MESRRTILYYPTINIPDGPWLRQALLYFDDVGSIFPTNLNWDWDDIGAADKLPAHMEILQKEGQYRRFAPEYLLRRADGWPTVHQLSEEFAALVKSDAFAKRRSRVPVSQYVRVHSLKIAWTVFNALQDTDLIAPPGPGDSGEWIRVDPTAADLYLGLLATALAQYQNDLSVAQLAPSDVKEVVTVVTGTDRRQHETLVWKTSGESKGESVAESRWLGVLPTPGNDVPIQKILEFKRERRDQLLQLRAETDSLADDLAKHDNPSRALVAWSERMQTQLSTLTRLMGESKLQVILGSMKAMLDLKKLGTLELLVGAGLAIAHAPVLLVVGGAALAGSFAITSEVLDHGSRKRKNLDGSAFSYLFSASNDGLFD